VKPTTLVALCLFTAVVRVLPAHAQAVPGEGGPDPAQVRVHIGPLMLSPTISLTNLGIDQNVFNDPQDKLPKRDFTFTITPRTALWLRIGRSWLTGNVTEDIVWYQTYATERSASTTYAVGWRAPLNHLTLTTGLSYARKKERPGYEIDARVERRDFNYRGAVEIRALSKTLFGVNAERRHLDFAENSFFKDIDLRDELSYVTTATGLSVRHELTPLTSVSMSVARSTDRFKTSPDRDSDSTSVAGTIVFNTFAIIKGSASLGYRDFRPLDPGLPGFKGTTGSANLSYTLMGATRFAIVAKRDVDYSYDLAQPYYVETGYDLTIAQQIFGPFDVMARLGRHALAYRNREGITLTVPDRVDHTRSYGVGVGYHMGKELRLGFNFDKVRRESDVADRRFNNVKFGTAITYGF
jgi:hypothetical protein